MYLGQPNWRFFEPRASPLTALLSHGASWAAAPRPETALVPSWPAAVALQVDGWLTVELGPHAPWSTALLADQITWWAPQRARDPWIAAHVRSMTGGGRPVLQMTKTAAAEAATALQKWLRAQP